MKKDKSSSSRIQALILPTLVLVAVLIGVAMFSEYRLIFTGVKTEAAVGDPTMSVSPLSFRVSYYREVTFTTKEGETINDSILTGGRFVNSTVSNKGLVYYDAQDPHDFILYMPIYIFITSFYAILVGLIVLLLFRYYLKRFKRR